MNSGTVIYLYGSDLDVIDLYGNDLDVIYLYGNDLDVIYQSACPFTYCSTCFT